MKGGWQLFDGDQVTLFVHSGNHRQNAQNERNAVRDGYVLLR